MRYLLKNTTPTLGGMGMEMAKQLELTRIYPCCSFLRGGGVSRKYISPSYLYGGVGAQAVLSNVLAQPEIKRRMDIGYFALGRISGN